MLLRLLWESFARQRRRKALAGLAILLGTTSVTAMLALANSIGDRIHRELSVYGANIVIFPKADTLSVNVGGVDLKPSTGAAYLHESDLAKLKTIFWANNINGLSPELSFTLHYMVQGGVQRGVSATGFWFDHAFGNGSARTGAPQLHPTWKLNGAWPRTDDEIVLGAKLAQTLGKKPGDVLYLPPLDATQHVSARVPTGQALIVTGIADTASALDEQVLMRLSTAQTTSGRMGAVSRVDVSATTKPEDAFARKDPDTLTPKLREVWYCRPYANSVAFQIREAIPGAQAEQVRRVEQSEGTVLERISGLMWLISAASLLSAGFAVSAAMATAVLERRGEIGLMRSLGASRGRIALLFYAEIGLLAVVAGIAGYLAGSVLAYWLGERIFTGDAGGAVLNVVLLPVVVAIALVVAVAGSTPSIRVALQMDPSVVLRGGSLKRLGMGRMLQKSLLHRRARSFSALVAMTVSAAVATALLTLYADLDAKLHHEFRGFGANVVVTEVAPETHFVSKVKDAAGIGSLAAAFGYAVATTDRGTPVVISGVDFADVQRLDSWWQVGRWPDGAEDALLGSRAAQFVANEQAVTLTFAGKVKTFHGAGQLKTGGDEDSRIYVPAAAFTDWTGVEANVVEVQVPGGAAQVEAVMARLRAALPQAQVTPVRQLIDGESRIVDRTHALMFGAVILIAMTVGISVLATLSTSVLERRRDFALMKALGGREWQMTGLFLSETLLLAGAGVAIGYILGSAAAWVISETNFHTATMPRLSVLPFVAVLNATIALLAAVLPMRTLRRLEPAALLKGE